MEKLEAQAEGGAALPVAERQLEQRQQCSGWFRKKARPRAERQRVAPEVHGVTDLEAQNAALRETGGAPETREAHFAAGDAPRLRATCTPTPKSFAWRPRSAIAASRRNQLESAWPN